MTQPAIKVEGLWKEYVVGRAQQAHGTFYDLLANTMKAPFQRLRNLGGKTDEVDRFWALQDINFEIQPGEVVGVVGSNGAGKSTLLKILSRITSPTKGRVEVRGRLASLLEVGIGFHPELTGRENIFLNATILGMRREEIAQKFDEIVEFSGVEHFLDTPVKRYSSGMYVRLAFSVSAFVEADILLIDEVLAVGDRDFQKKCLGMMGDVARGGKSVLFVSHNLTALRNICSKGLLLNNGHLNHVGNIDDVIHKYSSSRTESSELSIHLIEDSTSRIARVVRVEIIPQNMDSGKSIYISSPFRIDVLIEVQDSESDVGVYLHCHDSEQNRVFSTGSFFNPILCGMNLKKGFHKLQCNVPGHLLNDGQYSLDVILLKDRHEILVSESSLIGFYVHDESLGVEGWNWRANGVIRPRLEWTTEYIAQPLAIPSI